MRLEQQGVQLVEEQKLFKDLQGFTFDDDLQIIEEMKKKSKEEQQEQQDQNPFEYDWMGFNESKQKDQYNNNNNIIDDNKLQNKDINDGDLQINNGNNFQNNDDQDGFGWNFQQFGGGIDSSIHHDDSKKQTTMPLDFNWFSNQENNKNDDNFGNNNNNKEGNLQNNNNNNNSNSKSQSKSVNNNNGNKNNKNNNNLEKNDFSLSAFMENMNENESQSQKSSQNKDFSLSDIMKQQNNQNKDNSSKNYKEQQQQNNNNYIDFFMNSEEKQKSMNPNDNIIIGQINDQNDSSNYITNLQSSIHQIKNISQFKFEDQKEQINVIQTETQEKQNNQQNNNNNNVIENKSQGSFISQSSQSQIQQKYDLLLKFGMNEQELRNNVIQQNANIKDDEIDQNLLNPKNINENNLLQGYKKAQIDMKLNNVLSSVNKCESINSKSNADSHSNIELDHFDNLLKLDFNHSKTALSYDEPQNNNNNLGSGVQLPDHNNINQIPNLSQYSKNKIAQQQLENKSMKGYDLTEKVDLDLEQKVNLDLGMWNEMASYKSEEDGNGTKQSLDDSMIVQMINQNKINHEIIYSSQNHSQSQNQLSNRNIEDKKEQQDLIQMQMSSELNKKNNLNNSQISNISKKSDISVNKKNQQILDCSQDLIQKTNQLLQRTKKYQDTSSKENQSIKIMSASNTSLQSQQSFHEKGIFSQNNIKQQSNQQQSLNQNQQQGQDQQMNLSQNVCLDQSNSSQNHMRQFNFDDFGMNQSQLSSSSKNSSFINRNNNDDIAGGIFKQNQLSGITGIIEINQSKNINNNNINQFSSKSQKLQQNIQDNQGNNKNNEIKSNHSLANSQSSQSQISKSEQLSKKTQEIIQRSQQYKNNSNNLINSSNNINKIDSNPIQMNVNEQKQQQQNILLDDQTQKIKDLLERSQKSIRKTQEEILGQQDNQSSQSIKKQFNSNNNNNNFNNSLKQSQSQQSQKQSIQQQSLQQHQENEFNFDDFGNMNESQSQHSQNSFTLSDILKQQVINKVKSHQSIHDKVDQISNNNNNNNNNNSLKNSNMNNFDFDEFGSVNESNISKGSSIHNVISANTIKNNFAAFNSNYLLDQLHDSSGKKEHNQSIHSDKLNNNNNNNNSNMNSQIFSNQLQQLSLQQQQLNFSDFQSFEQSNISNTLSQQIQPHLNIDQRNSLSINQQIQQNNNNDNQQLSLSQIFQQKQHQQNQQYQLQQSTPSSQLNYNKINRNEINQQFQHMYQSDSNIDNDDVNYLTNLSQFTKNSDIINQEQSQSLKQSQQLQKSQSQLQKNQLNQLNDLAISVSSSRSKSKIYQVEHKISEDIQNESKSQLDTLQEYTQKEEIDQSNNQQKQTLNKHHFHDYFGNQDYDDDQNNHSSLNQDSSQRESQKDIQIVDGNQNQDNNNNNQNDNQSDVNIQNEQENNQQQNIMNQDLTQVSDNIQNYKLINSQIQNNNTLSVQDSIDYYSSYKQNNNLNDQYQLNQEEQINAINNNDNEQVEQNNNNFEFNEGQNNVDNNNNNNNNNNNQNVEDSDDGDHIIIQSSTVINNNDDNTTNNNKNNNLNDNDNIQWNMNSNNIDQSQSNNNGYNTFFQIQKQQDLFTFDQSQYHQGVKRLDNNYSKQEILNYQDNNQSQLESQFQQIDQYTEQFELRKKRNHNHSQTDQDDEDDEQDGEYGENLIGQKILITEQIQPTVLQTVQEDKSPELDLIQSRNHSFSQHIYQQPRQHQFNFDDEANDNSQVVENQGNNGDRNDGGQQDVQQDHQNIQNNYENNNLQQQDQFEQQEQNKFDYQNENNMQQFQDIGENNLQIQQQQQQEDDDQLQFKADNYQVNQQLPLRYVHDEDEQDEQINHNNNSNNNNNNNNDNLQNDKQDESLDGCNSLNDNEEQDQINNLMKEKRINDNNNSMILFQESVITPNDEDIFKSTNKQILDLFPSIQQQNLSKYNLQNSRQNSLINSDIINKEPIIYHTDQLSMIDENNIDFNQINKINNNNNNNNIQEDDQDNDLGINIIQSNEQQQLSSSPIKNQQLNEQININQNNIQNNNNNNVNNTKENKDLASQYNQNGNFDQQYVMDHQSNGNPNHMNLQVIQNEYEDDYTKNQFQDLIHFQQKVVDIGIVTKNTEEQQQKRFNDQSCSVNKLQGNNNNEILQGDQGKRDSLNQMNFIMTAQNSIAQNNNVVSNHNLVDNQNNNDNNNNNLAENQDNNEKITESENNQFDWLNNNNFFSNKQEEGQEQDNIQNSNNVDDLFGFGNNKLNQSNEIPLDPFNQQQQSQELFQEEIKSSPQNEQQNQLNNTNSQIIEEKKEQNNEDALNWDDFDDKNGSSTSSKDSQSFVIDMMNQQNKIEQPKQQQQQIQSNNNNLDDLFNFMNITPQPKLSVILEKKQSIGLSNSQENNNNKNQQQDDSYDMLKPYSIQINQEKEEQQNNKQFDFFNMNQPTQLQNLKKQQSDTLGFGFNNNDNLALSGGQDLSFDIKTGDIKNQENKKSSILKQQQLPSIVKEESFDMNKPIRLHNNNNNNNNNVIQEPEFNMDRPMMLHKKVSIMGENNTMNKKESAIDFGKEFDFLNGMQFGPPKLLNHRSTLSKVESQKSKQEIYKSMKTRDLIENNNNTNNGIDTPTRNRLSEMTLIQQVNPSDIVDMEAPAIFMQNTKKSNQSGSNSGGKSNMYNINYNGGGSSAITPIGEQEYFNVDDSSSLNSIAQIQIPTKKAYNVDENNNNSNNNNNQKQSQQSQSQSQQHNISLHLDIGVALSEKIESPNQIKKFDLQMERDHSHCYIHSLSILDHSSKNSQYISKNHNLKKIKSTNDIRLSHLNLQFLPNQIPRQSSLQNLQNNNNNNNNNSGSNGNGGNNNGKSSENNDEINHQLFLQEQELEQQQIQLQSNNINEEQQQDDGLNELNSQNKQLKGQILNDEMFDCNKKITEEECDNLTGVNYNFTSNQSEESTPVQLGGQMSNIWKSLKDNNEQIQQQNKIEQISIKKISSKNETNNNLKNQNTQNDISIDSQKQIDQQQQQVQQIQLQSPQQLSQEQQYQSSNSQTKGIYVSEQYNFNDEFNSNSIQKQQQILQQNQESLNEQNDQNIQNLKNIDQSHISQENESFYTVQDKLDISYQKAINMVNSLDKNNNNNNHNNNSQQQEESFYSASGKDEFDKNMQMLQSNKNNNNDDGQEQNDINIEQIEQPVMVRQGTEDLENELRKFSNEIEQESFNNNNKNNISELQQQDSGKLFRPFALNNKGKMSAKVDKSINENNNSHNKSQSINISLKNIPKIVTYEELNNNNNNNNNHDHNQGLIIQSNDQNYLKEIQDEQEQQQHKKVIQQTNYIESQPSPLNIQEYNIGDNSNSSENNNNNFNQISQNNNEQIVSENNNNNTNVNMNNNEFQGNLNAYLSTRFQPNTPNQKQQLIPSDQEYLIKINFKQAKQLTTNIQQKNSNNSDNDNNQFISQLQQNQQQQQQQITQQSNEGENIPTQEDICQINYSDINFDKNPFESDFSQSQNNLSQSISPIGASNIQKSNLQKQIDTSNNNNNNNNNNVINNNQNKQQLGLNIKKSDRLDLDDFKNPSSITSPSNPSPLGRLYQQNLFQEERHILESEFTINHSHLSDKDQQNKNNNNDFPDFNNLSPISENKLILKPEYFSTDLKSQNSQKLQKKITSPNANSSGQINKQSKYYSNSKYLNPNNLNNINQNNNNNNNNNNNDGQNNNNDHGVVQTNISQEFIDDMWDNMRNESSISQSISNGSYISQIIQQNQLNLQSQNEIQQIQNTLEMAENNNNQQGTQNDLIKNGDSNQQQNSNKNIIQDHNNIIQEQNNQQEQQQLEDQNQEKPQMLRADTQDYLNDMMNFWNNQNKVYIPTQSSENQSVGDGANNGNQVKINNVNNTTNLNINNIIISPSNQSSNQDNKIRPKSNTSPNNNQKLDVIHDDQQQQQKQLIKQQQQQNQINLLSTNQNKNNNQNNNNNILKSKNSYDVMNSLIEKQSESQLLESHQLSQGTATTRRNQLFHAQDFTFEQKITSQNQQKWQLNQGSDIKVSSDNDGGSGNVNGNGGINLEIYNSSDFPVYDQNTSNISDQNNQNNNQNNQNNNQSNINSNNNNNNKSNINNDQNIMNQQYEIIMRRDIQDSIISDDKQIKNSSNQNNRNNNQQQHQYFEKQHLSDIPTTRTITDSSKNKLSIQIQQNQLNNKSSFLNNQNQLIEGRLGINPRQVTSIYQPSQNNTNFAMFHQDSQLTNQQQSSSLKEFTPQKSEMDLSSNQYPYPLHLEISAHPENPNFFENTEKNEKETKNSEILNDQKTSSSPKQVFKLATSYLNVPSPQTSRILVNKVKEDSQKGKNGNELQVRRGRSRGSKDDQKQMQLMQEGIVDIDNLPDFEDYSLSNGFNSNNNGNNNNNNNNNNINNNLNVNKKDQIVIIKEVDETLERSPSKNGTVEVKKTISTLKLQKSEDYDENQMQNNTRLQQQQQQQQQKYEEELEQKNKRLQQQFSNIYMEMKRLAEMQIQEVEKNNNESGEQQQLSKQIQQLNQQLQMLTNINSNTQLTKHNNGDIDQIKTQKSLGVINNNNNNKIINNGNQQNVKQNQNQINNNIINEYGSTEYKLQQYQKQNNNNNKDNDKFEELLMKFNKQKQQISQVRQEIQSTHTSTSPTIKQQTQQQPQNKKEQPQIINNTQNNNEQQSKISQNYENAMEKQSQFSVTLQKIMQDINSLNTVTKKEEIVENQLQNKIKSIQEQVLKNNEKLGEINKCYSEIKNQIQNNNSKSPNKFNEISNNNNNNSNTIKNNVNLYSQSSSPKTIEDIYNNYTNNENQSFNHPYKSQYSNKKTIPQNNSPYKNNINNNVRESSLELKKQKYLQEYDSYQSKNRSNSREKTNINTNEIYKSPLKSIPILGQNNIQIQQQQLKSIENQNSQLMKQASNYLHESVQHFGISTQPSILYNQNKLSPHSIKYSSPSIKNTQSNHTAQSPPVSDHYHQQQQQLQQLNIINPNQIQSYHKKSNYDGVNTYSDMTKNLSFTSSASGNGGISGKPPLIKNNIQSQQYGKQQMQQYNQGQSDSQFFNQIQIKQQQQGLNTYNDYDLNSDSSLIDVNGVSKDRKRSQSQNINGNQNIKINNNNNINQLEENQFMKNQQQIKSNNNLWVPISFSPKVIVKSNEQQSSLMNTKFNFNQGQENNNSNNFYSKFQQFKQSQQPQNNFNNTLISKDWSDFSNTPYRFIQNNQQNINTKIISGSANQLKNSIINNNYQQEQNNNNFNVQKQVSSFHQPTQQSYIPEQQCFTFFNTVQPFDERINHSANKTHSLSDFKSSKIINNNNNNLSRKQSNNNNNFSGYKEGYQNEQQEQQQQQYQGYFDNVHQRIQQNQNVYTPNKDHTILLSNSQYRESNFNYSINQYKKNFVTNYYGSTS